MSTTVAQDRAFFKEVMEDSLAGILEAAIEWVGKNMNPDDVFAEKDLKHWAEENGYVKEN